MASSGNFATFNPLKYKASSYTTSGITSGNLQLSSKTGNAAQLNVGFKLGDGKFYYEVYGNTIPSSLHFGVCIDNADLNNVTAGKAIIGYRDSGNKLVSTAPQTNSTQSSYGASFTGGDIMGCAVDFTNGTIEFYKNNASQGQFSWSSANDGSTYYPYVYQNTGIATINTGQDSTFCGNETAQGNTDQNGFGDFYYTPPSGFLAMCSANLPTSSDIDPAQTDDDIPTKQFNTVLYTGNASTNAISNLNFQPDLVWVKSRSNAVNSYMADSSRGTNKILSSTLNEPERTETNLTSFDSDGFTLSSNYNYRANWNESSYTYVAWCWRANGGTTVSNGSGSITSTVQANTAAGFSIVTYTGNDGSWGSGNRDTFGHGLSAAPEFILVKELNATDQWTVFHAHVGNGGGSNAAANNLVLNDSSALYTNQSYKSFGETMPTSTLVTVEGNTTNSSSSNHVAYCWHSVDGYSKFGSYEGNDNTDGPFVYTGFRPRMVCIKGVDEAYAWFVFDSARNTNNLVDRNVRWDDSTQEAAEPTGARRVDFLANGFKIKASAASLNGNNDTYVYMAWGDVPGKYNNTF
tara:strand:+ start:25 stop:1752 length:1728 start_codon:yes stop_codon:yes gene_type:complete